MVVLDLLQWFLRVLWHVAAQAPAGTQPPPLHLEGGPGGLVAEALQQPMLRSLLGHTAHVVRRLTAHSSRNETLHALFSAALWYLARPAAAHSFVEHLLAPQVAAMPVNGIPGVTGMVVHREPGPDGVWYVSTEGSNFAGLYLRPHPWSPALHINRRRCRTTNVLETLATLGLEAVCWMFSVSHKLTTFLACQLEFKMGGG